MFKISFIITVILAVTIQLNARPDMLSFRFNQNSITNEICLNYEFKLWKKISLQSGVSYNTNTSPIQKQQLSLNPKSSLFAKGFAQHVGANLAIKYFIKSNELIKPFIAFDNQFNILTSNLVNDFESNSAFTTISVENRAYNVFVYKYSLGLGFSADYKRIVCSAGLMGTGAHIVYAFNPNYIIQYPKGSFRLVTLSSFVAVGYRLKNSNG